MILNKQIKISLFILITLSFFACSSVKPTYHKRLPGIWQAKPIIVDGGSKDWPAPYPEYDEKASLGYAVSNDADNLYITVETGDLATQIKILQEGLTVWIDKTGGKEEQIAINFPLPQKVLHQEEKDAKKQKPSGGNWKQVPKQSENYNEKRRIEMEDKVKQLLEESNEYSLQGFKGCNLQYPLKINDTCGIIVRLGIDELNEMVWEAVVPFKTFYYKHHIDKRDMGKAMSICFETIAAKRPPNQGSGSQGRGSGMGVRPGISLGIGGFGMGMGNGSMRNGSLSSSPNSQNENESLYKSTKTWKKFGIAWEE